MVYVLVRDSFSSSTPFSCFCRYVKYAPISLFIINIDRKQSNSLDARNFWPSIPITQQEKSIYDVNIPINMDVPGTRVECLDDTHVWQPAHGLSSRFAVKAHTVFFFGVFQS